MDDEAVRRRAHRKVAALRAFYIHLSVYVLVNILLFLINIVTSPHTLWFYWPLIGWGIAVLIQAMTVFGFSSGGWLGPDWEERKVNEYIRRDKER